MPNISINRNDLKDLGINLKDILKVLTNTTGDEIKIKKIKKSKKMKKKNKVLGHGPSKTRPQAELRRKDPRDQFNPFPNPNQPKFQQYPNTGGSSGFNAPIINITNPVGKDNNNNDSKLEKLNEKLDNKFNQLQTQNQTTYNGLIQAGYALHHIMNNQNNPPPLTYAYKSNSMNRYAPSPVDYFDGNGIIPNNGGVSNTNNNMNTFIDPNIDDSQNVDELQNLDDSQLPLDDSLLGLNRQQEISIDEGIFPSEEEELPIENKPRNVFDLLRQDVKNAEKRKGRPKGSRNRKHPLSSESLSQDYNTRTSGQTLINPQFQTPDTFVKRQVDNKMKQESIENMFRKSSQLPSTTPIEEEEESPNQKMNKPRKIIVADSDEDEDEEQIPITTFNVPRTINKKPNQTTPLAKIPTPPREPKPSKSSQIKPPTKRRSRSSGDQIVLG